MVELDPDTGCKTYSANAEAMQQMRIGMVKKMNWKNGKNWKKKVKKIGRNLIPMRSINILTSRDSKPTPVCIPGFYYNVKSYD